MDCPCCNPVHRKKLEDRINEQVQLIKERDEKYNTLLRNFDENTQRMRRMEETLVAIASGKRFAMAQAAAKGVTTRWDL